MTSHGNRPCNDVMTCCGGATYEYHHHVVQGCILREYFVFVCFFCVILFLGTFSDFQLISIFRVLQKARLTSRLHFFQLIFENNFFDSADCDSPKSCFERRGLRYGVQHLGGGEG